MKYLLTFFWTFLLTHMLTYVISSMIGVKYEFGTASILGIAVTILILIVPAILPNGPAEESGH